MAELKEIIRNIVQEELKTIVANESDSSDDKINWALRGDSPGDYERWRKAERKKRKLAGKKATLSPQRLRQLDHDSAMGAQHRASKK